uniref:mRNA interferase RelE/StbE n=1 Tax=Candidatus Kentrum sp. FW TaxID=2126338 RepID=A0A450TZ47_9GAMM|nr:MAG: mRNA interferase RelE/StbE [Candidatus Kentron sp. FW]
MSYSIDIQRSARKSLAGISQPHRTRIIERIRQLADNPRPPSCKKLIGRDAWRIRIGSYRVLYEIHDDRLVILVVSIGHRREIYR